jgi:hypothetical protein
MDSPRIKAALVLVLSLSSCQKLPTIEPYEWGDDSASKIAQDSSGLQPDLLRAERKLAEEMRRENWTTRLAESSRVGVTATSDGGASPVFSVDLLKLMRADETTEEAAARLYQLRRQHLIAVRAHKRELVSSDAETRALRAQVAALEAERVASSALLERGDVAEPAHLAVEAKLAAAESKLVQAQAAQAAKLDALESLTLLERNDLE